MKPAFLIAPQGILQRLLSFFLLLALLFNFAPHAYAQSGTPEPFTPDSSIDLTATPSFEGVFKYGEWVPLWVELANNGPDRQATVQVRVVGNNGSMVFRLPVELPTVSRKRLPLYIIANNFSRSLDVEVYDGDELLNKQRIALQPKPNISYLAALFSKERGALNQINTIKLPEPDRNKILVDEQLSAMPDRMEGIRSYDLIVLNDADTSSLSTEQAQALEAWVRQGGRLVIGGGANAQKTLAGLPKTLLPFTIESSLEIDDLSGLDDFVGGDRPVLVPGPFILATGDPGDGQVLASQQDRPLVTEYALGSGYVDFIGLDLSIAPFDAWNGTTAFWEKLVSPGAAYPSNMPPDISARQQMASNMPYVLSNLPMLELPSISSLALLLGLYILVIGPVNYLVLRRMKRLHFGWITIPLITIIFSIGAFALGYAMHGNVIFINKAAVIELDPDGAGRATSFIGFFSPTQERYDVTVESDALISPLGPFYDPWAFSSTPFGTSQEMVVTQGNPSTVSGASTDQWTMQSFMTEGMPMDFGQLSAELSMDGESLSGVIRNESKHDIEGAIIILGRRFQKLGDLPADAEVEVNLDMTDLGAPFWGSPLSYRIFEQEFAQPGDAYRRYEVRRAIIENLFERSTPFKSVSGSFENPYAGQPVFLGWLSEAPPEVRIGDETPNQQTTAAVLYPLTYTTEETNKISLPAGTIPGTITRVPIEGGTCGDANVTSVYMVRGEAEFEYRLPAEALKAVIEHLKLGIWTDSGTWDPHPEVALYNWQTESWAPLSGVEQGINLVPASTDFINSEGLVQVQLSGENLPGGCYYIGLGLEASKP